MFLSLLAMETAELMALISIIAIAVLLVALVVVCVCNKKADTRSLVYAAVCIATSFALSFLKVTPVTYGGSITLASFVPLLIYAYAYGPVRGLIAGLIFGILQFIQSPYLLTPMTFILDYLLAFAAIALMGFGPKLLKNKMGAVLLGCGLVYIARFVMHLVSGILYFNLDAVWAELPANSAFLYSFLYQCCYLPADCAICMIVLAVFVQQKVFDRLVALMTARRASAPVVVAEAAADSQTPKDRPRDGASEKNESTRK